MSYFFSLYWSLSSSSCTVFGAILSNIYEVLSINQSSKVFVFGELKVHQKDWIIYSGETDRPGKFCCNFSISNNLTQMVNSPTEIPDCESQSYSFKFIYMASDPVAVSISTDFLSISKGMTFSFTAYDCSWADWYHLSYHLRDVQWEDIFFKLGASATAIQFCKWVHVGTDAYLIFYIRSNLTYVHDSQLLVLLP